MAEAGARGASGRDESDSKRIRAWGTAQTLKHLLLLLPCTILKHLQSKMNLESRYKSLFLLKNCHIISLLYDYTVDFILNSDAEIHV